MKALIAMSGGVDSSVAAFLMKEQGYDCMGVTMKLYHNEDAGLPKGHTCCSLDDVEDARNVAYGLHMPYYVFNFSHQFREKVIAPFVEAYTRGRTPNPCIDCNRYLKFEHLFRRAQALGCDCVVTGHYARIGQDPNTGLYQLKKAVDAAKDQSYMLYAMTQEQLAHTRFPLGELTKPEVRDIAVAQGFLNARKHDSQDICFVADGDYAGFIERYTGQASPPGQFVDSSGKELGTHRGIIRYTVGQRRGLGLAAPERLYVCRICPEDNTVVLGPREALETRRVQLEEVHWIAGAAPKEPFRCKAKLRYHHPEQWATVTPLAHGGAQLLFDTPQRGPAPGQAAVLYDGDVVLGGGIIRE